MKANILRVNDRYSQQVENLFAEMAHYDEARLNRKPVHGGWSAIQTMHHLVLVEELSLAYVQKKLSFNPSLERAGFRTRWNGIRLWSYLNVPLKVKAPALVGDDKLPAYASLADTSARWRNARAAWTAFLTDMPETLADKAVYKQPFAGRLSWAQTIGFFRNHFNRHLKQIRSALR